MCVSAPKTPATSSQAPTQTTATNLQLGTATLEKNQATVLGRLALTAPKRQSGVGTPGGTSTGTTPAGTLGLAPGASIAGDPITGAKSYTPFTTGYNR